MLKLVKANKDLERKNAKHEKAIRTAARNKAINEMISLARDKGMDDAAIKANVTRWASLDDAKFEGVKIALEGLPKVASRSNAAVKRVIREAARGVMKADAGELDGVDQPVVGRSRNRIKSAGVAGLENIDGIFEDDWGNEGPSNSF